MGKPKKFLEIIKNNKDWKDVPDKESVTGSNGREYSYEFLCMLEDSILKRGIERFINGKKLF